MKLRKNFLIGLISCFLLPVSVAAQSAEEDLLLPILQKEIDEQYHSFLRIVNPVYFLSYRVEETDDHVLAASMGSCTQSRHKKERILTIQIRLGSPKLDNFHPLGENASDMFFVTHTIRLPMDDNEQAIHQILARATQTAYWEAARKYRQVLTNVTIKGQEQDTPDDYTLLPPVHYYESPVPVSELYFEDWQEKLNACTAEFVDEEAVIDGSATLHYYTVRKYFVSSEGTSIVENHSYTYFTLTATAQADDGMILPLHKTLFLQHPDELPPVEQLIEEARNMKIQLSQLECAPVAEAFVGPAIISNEAAGAFFHEIIGRRLEGSSFKNEANEQTFKNKIGKRIMTDDFTITFDPTTFFYNDFPLSGAYHYDDEGIAGQRVVAVKHGILQNFLMSRAPIENFYMSNGHGRAEATRQPEARESNLFVTVEHPHTDAELRQMLLQEAVVQGKEYGYWIQSVRSAYPTTDRHCPNTFNIKPLLVYRLYVDGRPDELVRGIDMIGTPLSILSQIVAGGNLTDCFADICDDASGYVPVHCCAPAIFIRSLEMQKQVTNHDRPPLLPRPVSENVIQIDNFAELAFKAMQDELSTNMADLKLDKMLPPYYIGYLITDARIAAVTSTLGSIITEEERPYRDFETRILVGSDRVNNENFVDENSLFDTTTSTLPFPLDNDYQNVRRSLWKATDEKYKQAAALYVGKEDALKLQNLPKTVTGLDDRSEAVCEPYFNDCYYESLSVSYLREIACELSQLFTGADSLVSSGVNIYAYQANAFFLASDGVQYAQPFSFICIHIYAEATAEDGEPLMDCTNLFYKDIENVPSSTLLKRHIIQMIEKLQASRHAPKITKSYVGPVLVTGDAAAQWFGYAFLESSFNIVASRQPVCSNPEFLQWYRQYLPADNPLEQWIDKKVIDNHLTVTAMEGTAEFDGLELIGSYRVDAEGLRVDEERNYIESGVLLSLLSNRTPTPQIFYSNGHERLALTGNRLTTTRGAGVLSLSGSIKTSEDKLKKNLLKQAKAGGYKYAYIIRKMADRNMCSVPNAKVFYHEQHYRPIYLYRVDVATGQETLVRTAKIEELNLKTFKKLIAVSKTKFAYNTLVQGQCKSYGSDLIPLSGIPCSLIVPTALLFDNIEIEPALNIPLKPDYQR